MNILLLGSGGREHALAWKISQSPRCSRLFVAPGNPGTAECATNADLYPNDFQAVARFCLENGVGMLVVGPEEPLVKGIADHFKSDPALAGIAVIGPSASAARLEGSKAFAKDFMTRHGIPTAAYREFDKDSYTEGVAYLQSHGLPIVLKADGLAAGKGVVIARSHLEAIAEFELMLQYSKFGEASRRVVVEEFLTGIEMSVFVLTDGVSHVMLPEAKDYKRVGEGDTGLNTGGMGAVSPVPFADEAFMEKVRRKVVEPTMSGLRKDGIDYRGFVFIGLIRVGDDPYVIEYNCRMGDPETEVVVPRLRNDLVDLFSAVAEVRLAGVSIDTDPRSAATVVLVSGGYPGLFEKGKDIEGLDILNEDDVMVFHAGTALKEGRLVTNGGRVLAVTAYGKDVSSAVRRSLKIIEFIDYEGKYHRRDIGFEFADQTGPT
jgi:phosphoribosylamine--glycine ligase